MGIVLTEKKELRRR